MERPATLVSTMKKLSCQICFDFGWSSVIPIYCITLAGKAMKIINDFLEFSEHV